MAEVMERVVGQAAASVRSTAARTAMVVEVGGVRVESAHARTANACSDSGSDSDSDTSSVRETLTHQHAPNPNSLKRLFEAERVERTEA